MDSKLEKEMDLAYTIVKLGRSARNSANIKNRQPLSKMLISEKALPTYYGDIVKEELNIKEVELGANMAEYVNFEIKPNLPVLGREYGRYIPKIREEITKHNQMELAVKILNGGSEFVQLDEDTTLELNHDNLLITMQGKEGFAFSGEGEIGVVLDTKLTDSLIEEGFLREILSKVQNMRKESGFEVLDNIILYVAGNEKLEKIIQQYEEQIKRDTLALEVVYNKPQKDYVENHINGETLQMKVEKK